MGYLQNPFLRFNEMLNDYYFAKTSFERLKKVENYNPFLTNKSLKCNSFNVPIQFKKVNVSIEGKQILNNLSFTIKPNSTIAFLGMTGSGKSSIANVLMRFIDYQSGDILVDETDLKEFDFKTIRSRIGYVFQNPFLFSDTIYNNIFYGIEEPKREDLALLKKVCALDFVDELELGFETIIGEKGVGLSGGQKQRIALARALAKFPDLLILDDMTSALDIETEKKIVEEIYQMDFPCTKLIIAEKIVSVKNADCIYVLDNGEILESGTHEELLKLQGYYYQIYLWQSGVK